MKRKCLLTALSVLLALVLSGCAVRTTAPPTDRGAAPPPKQAQTEQIETQQTPSQAQTGDETPGNEPGNENKGNDKMNVTVNGQTFAATLAEGAAAEQLKALLPLTLSMTELNGNEKYGSLPEALTQETYAPGTIYAGDILLWGADTLVVFYKTFSSPYRYTKIGRIENPTGIEAAVGRGDVSITFSLAD